MPNWCYNIMTIRGDKKELKRFKEFSKTENHTENNLLDTNKFIPYPQKFREMDKKDCNNSFNVKKKEELVDGMNGYDWCCCNWGTKWGICRASIRKETDKMIVYDYDTAWSPAIPVMMKMSELFPKLTFEFDISYEGDNIVDHMLISKGKIIKSETNE